MGGQGGCHLYSPFFLYRNRYGRPEFALAISNFEDPQVRLVAIAYRPVHLRANQRFGDGVSDVFQQDPLSIGDNFVALSDI